MKLAFVWIWVFCLLLELVADDPESPESVEALTLQSVAANSGKQLYAVSQSRQHN